MRAMCTAPTLTRTRLGAMLVHGVFTCFRHFSWDMKLQTAGRELGVSPMCAKEVRGPKTQPLSAYQGLRIPQQG